MSRAFSADFDPDAFDVEMWDQITQPTGVWTKENAPSPGWTPVSPPATAWTIDSVTT
jgi:hypothetical protein